MSSATRSLTNGVGHTNENLHRETIIKIDKRTHPFAQIDTRALNDGSISWKAKGLHAYLLSKPRIWQVRFSDLVNHATDRAYSVRSALGRTEDCRLRSFATAQRRAGSLLRKLLDNL